MATDLESLTHDSRAFVEASRKINALEGIRRFLTELYPHNAHFIYELLQNAEDAGASEVRFTLSQEGLDFEHNGSRLFTFDNVKAITSIGNTSKNDHTSIGKFGVGFKAVFAYTNTPEIHSGDFHFRIRDLVVPETENVPRPNLGPRETRFFFPFDNPKKTRKHAGEEVDCGLRALGDNTLLFLSNIRKVEYLLPDCTLGGLERIELDNGLTQIRATQPEGGEKLSHWLRYEKVVNVPDEDGDVKCHRIAIAYSVFSEEDKSGKSRWRIVPVTSGQVSIYFPAEKETSNLRFHLHAPFASTVARDSVRDIRANDLLRDHLAELVVESLGYIKSRGLLTVAFLAVLPNPSDGLSKFYEPIRQKIIQAFRKSALTPTKSGEYAPAGELYRGPSRIQEALDDEDLTILTGYASPLWAKNPPQENQREARFLDSLELDEWSWSELATAMSATPIHAWTEAHFAARQKQKNLIESWIAEKQDAWLMRFYALLSEANEDHGEAAETNTFNIVRVASESGDRHVLPSEAFFVTEGDAGEISSDALFVKQAVYAAGSSVARKNHARAFLERAGVRPYDVNASIKHVLQRYKTGHEFPRKSHIKHIRQFAAYWEQDADNAKLFEDVPLLLGQQHDEKERYFLPSELYLDAPYVETGMTALFEDEKLKIEKPKNRLSTHYTGIRKFAEFAAAIGVMRRLEICEHCATKLQPEYFKKLGRETASTIDTDYFLNGLSWLRKGSDSYLGTNLFSCWSIPLSRAIWLAMCEAPTHALVARYVPNNQRRHDGKEKTSFLVDDLSNRPWVPSRDGRFLRPSEMDRELLHPDFEFDDRNGWLTAVKFGEGSRQRTAEYVARNQEAQRFGFASVEEADEFKQLKCAGFSVSDFSAYQSQRQQTERPKQAVVDPVRRSKNVLANVLDAPFKESVRRERAIQKGVSELTALAKANLRGKYTNSDGRLDCQCCHQEMPFKLPEGEYYFEAVQCIDDRDGDVRNFQNRLALCPNCAAMYKHVRETDDIEMRRRIVNPDIDEQCPAVEIPVRLGGREFVLYFVGTHWFDLKTIFQGNENR